jgi:dolichyl-phosphate beta-glucosyltransferase
MSAIKLTIVVPAYHEADRITQSLQDLSDAIKKYLDPKTTEVIVVSADSPDSTADVAEKSGKLFTHFSVLRPGPRVGKGRDVRAGILAGTGEYRMFMDADMATPLHHLQQIQAFMEKGGDMSIGIRPLASIHIGFRKYVSEFGNVLVRTLLTPGISDSQCGFKVFRADVAQELFPRLTILGWGFDMELLTIARIHKYSIDIMQIPDWHDPKEEGLTGDSSIKVTLQTGVDLLKVLSNRLLRRYK